MFSTTSKEWTLLSTTTEGEGPSARSGHVMTAVGSDIYLHGGIGSADNAPRDSALWLWVFSTTRMEWTLLTTGGKGPSARYDHAMTAGGSDIYLYGGSTDNGEPRDRVRR